MARATLGPTTGHERTTAYNTLHMKDLRTNKPHEDFDAAGVHQLGNLARCKENRHIHTFQEPGASTGWKGHLSPKAKSERSGRKRAETPPG